MHDEVFGVDHALLGRIARDATARGRRRPSSRGGGDADLRGPGELHDGTEFASLWGGGTVPAWRGRGVFRALVAHRAALAAARGCRYLQVDASDDSRPILQRLGFVQLAVTTPFVHPGGEVTAVSGDVRPGARAYLPRGPGRR